MTQVIQKYIYTVKIQTVPRLSQIPADHAPARRGRRSHTAAIQAPTAQYTLAGAGQQGTVYCFIFHKRDHVAFISRYLDFSLLTMSRRSFRIYRQSSAFGATPRSIPHRE